MISAVLESGEFILGPSVRQFEASLADYHGVSCAVGVGSGLDAIALTLKALNIGPGDEVITVPNSFVATAAAIDLVGAKIVFVDVDEEMTMNPDLLADAITPHTRAIIPVHLTGRPAPMNDIMYHAGRCGAHVIEDCAQAIGATLNGQPVGRFGIAGCFSLHPLKNLGGCGDGGIVITDDTRLADRLQLLRNHGLQDRNTCLTWGHNSRLDSVQAAILNARFAHLPQQTEQHRKNAIFYLSALHDLPLRLPKERPGESCVWYAFVVQTSHRNRLQKFLEERGIESLVHYPIPIHLQPAAAKLAYGRGAFPVCEEQANTMLSLPIRSSLTRGELEYIATAMCDFFADIT